uniref:Uncharacterized protein n=1 Tax=Arundo donax TaxID=35708 RepID=A0A0A9B0A7_ARUDO
MVVEPPDDSYFGNIKYFSRIFRITIYGP